MPRVLSRALMLCIGLAVFVGYSAVAGLFALVLWWLVADPPGLKALAVGFLLVVLVGGFVGYRVGTLRLVANLEARELSRQYAPGVYRLLSRLCLRMNVREPQLLVAELGAPNALSLGGPRAGVVVLDRELFALLTADELEAILAHELAHMERYDTFLKTLFVTAARLLVSVVSLLLVPAFLFLVGVDRAVAWAMGRPREWRYGLAALFHTAVQFGLSLAFFPLTLLLLAYSRRREYAADRRAVDVTGKPTALARALAKIHRAAAPRGGLLSLLYIHGQEEHRPPPWLSTHPPVERRIELLLSRTQVERGNRRIDRLRP